MGSFPARQSLHGIHERRQALNPHLQPVARFDGTNAAGCASEDYIAGKQSQIGGHKANEIKTVENELARIGVLAELPILEKLDVQVVRIDLGFDIGTERREGIKGFSAGPLAFAVLNGSIADVLGGGVAENVA